MSTISKNLKKLPDSPGVYFFKDGKGAVLYIGKATSLRSRVKSYFREDLAVTRGPKIVQMLEQAKSVDFVKTDSVLEALLLEAELIKKHQPKYNTDLKDDKTHNLVAVTKEEFPRVLVVRKSSLGNLPASRLYPPPASDADSAFKSPKPLQIRYSFGPFPYGMQLREAMRIIRQIFPYRDKCTPNQGKPCFNAQIGLCPGVCLGVMTRQEYAKTIRNIKLFFEGEKKMLVRKLKREMHAHAKKLEFEKADVLKRQIFALQHIQDVALIKLPPLTPSESSHRAGEQINLGFRVEAYDIAHISGTNVVGVMVVVEGGEASKSEYRKFKIKSFAGSDDTRALREILTRRFSHPEWSYPRLIVVDGGKAQVNVAEKVLKEAGIEIAIVGVVKDEHHKPREILGDAKLRRTHEKEILLANSEAHRFAIKYHREKRSKI